ncbi:hypothetical protein M422DRAFT_263678 [Sphaerobolus stellatus SS14]|uniref:CCHC-type domain-containing protein n=1 Tax=Sphaerobolus stellatus (strain SS14) TaxID=990650 RepID=A0A0C9UH61_SPHS4|nr:hypothetical protein M422DRAFT_263678 [Sphaerobolus stellatus SS14]
MNALREEIKDMISATIKEKLCSDADSVTTVSQSMTALDANVQYWSDLSNKAAHHSCRALELQLKMAEEKVNILLHEEAPKEALLEAAREVHTIHFQLDQNTCLCEAGIIPEQQVRFRTDTGGSVNNPFREYGVNPIHDVHIARPEADAPLPRQSTPALSMTAQLDGAVVNRTTEYSSIQQMVRQAIQNASHEAEPEKSFLAKASVKMGNPPTYSGKVQLQFLEWFDREIKHWDLKSIIMGLQKWFMPTLSMNKVAVNYDSIMQGSMTMQQLHQELSKLAKQMIELPDAYSYRRGFMNALKPDMREQVLRKGFTPEFSNIDELMDEAVTFDNGGGGDVRVNPTYGKNPVKLGNTVNKPTQSNSVRTAAKANNTVVYYNCNQLGHIRPNCPFPDKDRRVAGARIEEAILEKDESQIEEFDKDAPHPEEQQDWEDQLEEDDQ